MSNAKNEPMKPISSEIVEVDGVYANEWGREEELKRGDSFPADPILGQTEWTLKEYSFDNHHEGRTDPRLVPKENDTDKQGKIDSPRNQVDQGEK